MTESTLDPEAAPPPAQSLTDTLTGPPAGSTAPVQPAGSELERPAPTRRRRPRHSGRPSWAISIRGERRASALRSRKHPRGGEASGGDGAVNALGEIHRSGARHSI